MRERDGETEVRIPVDSVELDGLLGIPSGAKGIVLFAHGSGSSRLSPRNSYVGCALGNRVVWPPFAQASPGEMKIDVQRSS